MQAGRGLKAEHLHTENETWSLNVHNGLPRVSNTFLKRMSREREMEEKNEVQEKFLLDKEEEKEVIKR
jgi:hypothetical protein